jgi:hypothetical protein
MRKWSGSTSGSWTFQQITSLVPRPRLEMVAARHTTMLAGLAESPPPTTILIGEKTRLAPRALARQLGPALHATTIVVPGAAHMIPVCIPRPYLTPCSLRRRWMRIRHGDFRSRLSGSRGEPTPRRLPIYCRSPHQLLAPPSPATR